jgi:hypothetical protein
LPLRDCGFSSNLDGNIGNAESRLEARLGDGGLGVLDAKAPKGLRENIELGVVTCVDGVVGAATLLCASL